MLVLLITSCNSNVFNKNDLQYIELTKYTSDSTFTSINIYDSHNIELLFDEYLNNSSEGFGKVYAEYKIVLPHNNDIRDTIYIGNISYRSAHTGTRMLKKDANVFLDHFFR